MFFDIFRSSQSQSTQLSREQLQEQVLYLLLQMAWLDGKTDEREIELLTKILVHVYHFDSATVRSKIDSFDPVKQKPAAGEALRELPMRERIQLLRDLWAVALVDDKAGEKEQALFYRAARLLDVKDNEFLERCIKVKP
ncbi:MAG: hypothetical protein COW18_02545 [Zetaproteobacteria bacterium CG12_big_fil_rev_8_21_14_0_65_54_13]|nr:MAG: hypothetical protein COX55_04235 [Zetaproteobacteria bacterium CG23_combo_of_CG06-09_8_20_14_all_54_7]PIW51061.1 MAG: hypothetical protein COW18_02545 [Zetaproteobacteria bacterium CG12_big_fil_rev_8_21_14_0_65_54_13]PIX54021.1 MAG: hypothetical protein COZ50_10175 [Zetaproteobacteria bacterium CG_4_10_14_3_um_filter_54_28]PJA28039.1 MAG: hypothetical protein CO188_10765 [Zetaproteobacteria bacterium CG_4_9_14_3_um_filter_54_145]